MIHEKYEKCFKLEGGCTIVSSSRVGYNNFSDISASNGILQEAQ
jgi:hypothetical protein